MAPDSTPLIGIMASLLLCLLLARTLSCYRTLNLNSSGLSPIQNNTAVLRKHHQSPPDACAPAEILVYTQHKSGTMMARSAVAGINLLLPRRCKARVQDYNCPPQTALPRVPSLAGGVALKTTRAVHSLIGASCQLPPLSQCVAHIARDPFEMVLSGYGYHRSETAPSSWDRIWLQAPMWSDSVAYDTIGEPLPWPHVRFVTTVSDAASGPLRGQLSPPADVHESYSHYLRRVPEAHGLLAEAYSALQLTLPAMTLLYGKVEKRAQRGECAAVVCLEDFMRGALECRSAWRRLLSGLRIPRDHLAAVAAAAADTSCPMMPVGASVVRLHSSRTEGNRSDPRDTWRAMLQRIDVEVLNGSLAALSRSLPCWRTRHRR